MAKMDSTQERKHNPGSILENLAKRHDPESLTTQNVGIPLQKDGLFNLSETPTHLIEMWVQVLSR